MLPRWITKSLEQKISDKDISETANTESKLFFSSQETNEQKRNILQHQCLYGQIHKLHPTEHLFTWTQKKSWICHLVPFMGVTNLIWKKTKQNTLLGLVLDITHLSAWKSPFFMGNSFKCFKKKAALYKWGNPCFV